MRETYCLFCGCADNSSSEVQFNDVVHALRAAKDHISRTGKLAGAALSVREKQIVSRLLKLSDAEQTKVISKLRSLLTYTKWMTKGVMLMTNGEVIECVSLRDNNGIFRLKKRSALNRVGQYAKQTSPIYYETNSMKYGNPSMDDKYPPGIFVHKPCYDLACKVSDVEIHYGMIPHTSKGLAAVRKAHAEISKWYIEEKNFQFFNYAMCVLDGGIDHITVYSDAWEKNCIVAVKALEISNRYENAEPPVAAKFYANGDYKMGMDGEIWKLKSGKWVEAYVDSKSKTPLNYNYFIRQPYEVSKRGLFLLDKRFYMYL